MRKLLDSMIDDVKTLKIALVLFVCFSTVAIVFCIIVEWYILIVLFTFQALLMITLISLRLLDLRSEKE